jgi:endonuclease G
MPSYEERVASVERRLTPAVRQAVERAIALNRVPAPLRAVLAQPARDGLGGRGEPRPEGLAPSAEARGRGHLGAEFGAVPLAGLEAIVQRFGRPPLLIHDDRVVLEDLDDFPEGTDALIRGVERWIPSVGRIEFLNNAMAWGGTGWIVREGGGRSLVITNRHVASVVAGRRADGRAIFLRSPYGPIYGAAIDFLAEEMRLEDTSRTVRLSGVEYLADEAAADVALLRIEATGFVIPPPLELHEGRVRARDLVAVIGYPAYDPRNNVDDQARYFRDLYEVKRFAPGLVMQEPSGTALFSHDCTTLGGNSGSPLIRLEDGRAIGLHFQGLYGKNNAAVGAATVAALLRGERPVAVRLPEAFAERADGHHRADDFTGRSGFVPGFLGDAAPAAPWPGLPGEILETLARPSDNPPEPHELRYTHFGVKYCARRKLPVMTAVNIDGGRTVRIKRGDDQWFTDGRIPREIQLGQANFADPQIDRGHMVRREDPNWGEPAEAQRANDDTFHYVNAAPQHASLNQGKTLWQGLENYILDSARTHGLRACVFTGPVLRRDDEEEEVMIDGAVVPREFWKLVVTLDAGDQDLHATAYLLSQGELIRRLLETRGRREGLEGFTLGAYRTFQLAVSDLSEATGYDFSAYVQADPLRRLDDVQEALTSREPVFLPLESLADIRLGPAKATSAQQEPGDVEATGSAIAVAAVVRAWNDRPEEERAFRADGGEEGASDPHVDPDEPPPVETPQASPLERPARWRVAKALLALRAQVDALAPNRRKASDGTIGDDRHCGHAGALSDHCARMLDGAVAVVTALDITHDPNNGCDAAAIADAIRRSRDPRVKYVISNRRIASAKANWAWRSYGGDNPHTKHCHISVKADPSLFDATSRWTLA